MILAAPGDTGYDLMLLLHILAVMAAFSPVFIHPLLSRQVQSMSDNAERGVLGAMAANGRRIYAPALLVGGLLGFGLVGMSDDVYALGDGWVLAAIIVWIAQNGVVHALILPGERAWSHGDQNARRRVDLGGGIVTLLLVIQLVLMVFKPGA